MSSSEQGVVLLRLCFPRTWLRAWLLLSAHHTDERNSRRKKFPCWHILTGDGCQELVPMGPWGKLYPPLLWDLFIEGTADYPAPLTVFGSSPLLCDQVQAKQSHFLIGRWLLFLVFFSDTPLSPPNTKLPILPCVPLCLCNLCSLRLESAFSLLSV